MEALAGKRGLVLINQTVVSCPTQRPIQNNFSRTSSRTTKTLVSLLLLLLLAFGGGYWAARHNAAQSTVTSPAPGEAVPMDSQISKPATVPDSAALATFDWRMVESEDYKKYIANLCAVGCPEKTIRDIIIAASPRFAPASKNFHHVEPFLTLPIPLDVNAGVFLRHALALVLSNRRMSEREL